MIIGVKLLVPPPNLTGDLHIGHGMNMVCSDIYLKYREMLGDEIEIIYGNDHAGNGFQKLYIKKYGYDSRLNMLKNAYRYCNELKLNHKNSLNNLGIKWPYNNYWTLDNRSRLITKNIFNKLLNDNIIKLLYYPTYCRIINNNSIELISISDIEYKLLNYYIYNYQLIINGENISIYTYYPEYFYAITAIGLNNNIYNKLNIKDGVDMGELGKIPIINLGNVGYNKFIIPGHDEEDYWLAIANDINIKNIIDNKGRLINVPDRYKGLDIDEFRKYIIEMKFNNKKLIKIYKPIDILQRKNIKIITILALNYILNTNKLTKLLINKLNNINIIPNNRINIIKNRLNNIKPWCISRYNWWGLDIPTNNNINTKLPIIPYFEHNTIPTELLPIYNTSEGQSTPPEVTSTSIPLAVEASPLEVHPAVSSSNLLSQMGKATPGDRGEGSDGSFIMGMMEDGSKDMLDVTSSGVPGSDLRELEGEINKEATTASGREVGVKDVTSSGENGVKEDYGDKKHYNYNLPHELYNKPHYELGIEGDDKDWTSSGMKSSTGPQVEPAADLREAEGKVNREAPCNGKDGPQVEGCLQDEKMNSVKTSGVTSSGKGCYRSIGIGVYGNEVPYGMVFDTWFTSSLWPIITGFINNNDDDDSERILLTCYDILELWVCRMLLLCNYLNNDTLFNKIYLHGMVIDKYGKKMSKSIGNTINIQQFINNIKANIHTLHTQHEIQSNSSPPDAQSNSRSPAESSSPPEVTTSVGLADSSSNYLSLKGDATPGDRGGSIVIGPQVETSSGSEIPGSDPRELEGEVNREGRLQDENKVGDEVGSRMEMDWTSSGEDAVMGYSGDKKHYNYNLSHDSDNKPHYELGIEGGDEGSDGSSKCSDGSSIMGMMEDGAKDVLDVTSSGMKCSTRPRVEPVADLREAEGEINKEADGRTSSGGEWKTSSEEYGAIEGYGDKKLYNISNNIVGKGYNYEDVLVISKCRLLLSSIFTKYDFVNNMDDNILCIIYKLDNIILYMNKICNELDIKYIWDIPKIYKLNYIEELFNNKLIELGKKITFYIKNFEFNKSLIIISKFIKLFTNYIIPFNKFNKNYNISWLIYNFINLLKLLIPFISDYIFYNKLPLNLNYINELYNWPIFSKKNWYNFIELNNNRININQLQYYFNNDPHLKNFNLNTTYNLDEDPSESYTDDGDEEDLSDVTNININKLQKDANELFGYNTINIKELLNDDNNNDIITTINDSSLNYTTHDDTASDPTRRGASYNYLPVNGNATPGDRGEGSDGSFIMGMMEDGSKDMLDVTSSGVPGSDLRELEGEINKKATTASGRGEVSGVGKEMDWTSSGENGVKEGYGDKKHYNYDLPHDLDNKPHDSHVVLEEDSDVTSSGKPESDLRELEGEVNREAVCKTTSGGTASGKTLGGGGERQRIRDYLSVDDDGELIDLESYNVFESIIGRIRSHVNKGEMDIMIEVPEKHLNDIENSRGYIEYLVKLSYNKIPKIKFITSHF